MRKGILAEGEYYHVYNRGVDKRDIFLCSQDYERFLLTMFICRKESPSLSIKQVHVLGDSLSQKVLEFATRFAANVPLVEIVCFCFMPNHFHLLLREVTRGGVSKFMQRLSDSYTKAFNVKYERTGVLFGSKYQFIHVDRNEYLLYLSRYIHRNPIELLRSMSLSSYQWSSYSDYIAQTRWGDSLVSDIIMGQFQTGQSYHEYVEDKKVPAIANDYLID